MPLALIFSHSMLQTYSTLLIKPYNVRSEKCTCETLSGSSLSSRGCYCEGTNVTKWKHFVDVNITNVLMLILLMLTSLIPQPVVSSQSYRNEGKPCCCFPLGFPSSLSVFIPLINILKCLVSAFLLTIIISA